MKTMLTVRIIMIAARGSGNEARRKGRTPADEKKREIAYNMTYYANPSVLQVKSDRLKPRRK